MRGINSSRAIAVFLAAATVLPSCGESGGSSAFASSDGSPGGQATDGAGDGADAVDAADVSDGADAGDGLPPEVESTVSLPTPAAGESHVFIPSQLLDVLVRIHGESLAVTLLDTGLDPVAVARVDADDTVSVLAVNAGSDDVSLFRDAEAEAPSAAEIADLPTPANQLALCPDHRFAVTWRAPGPMDALGTGSLQDVSLVRLDPLGVVSIGVGFRPSKVEYFGTGAFVLSDSGVSRIELDDDFEPRFAPAVAVSADPLENPRDREVVLLDASTAAVRTFGEPMVRFVALADGAFREVTLEGAPTDLDVTLGGAEVLAVLRDRRELVRLANDESVAPVTLSLGDLPAGQAEVDEAGGRAVAFTSVVTDSKGELTKAGNEWLVVVDLEGGAEPRVVPLVKGVAAVVVSPDGRRAVVLHDRRTHVGAEEPIDRVDAQVDAAPGFSVVDLDSGYAKLELPGADPLGVALRDGRALVLVPEGASPGGALDVDLQALSVRRVELGSPPTLAIGVGSRTAILQEHPAGRVTFLDHDSGATETVTGFQLNSKIK